MSRETVHKSQERRLKIIEIGSNSLAPLKINDKGRIQYEESKRWDREGVVTS